MLETYDLMLIITLSTQEYLYLWGSLKRRFSHKYTKKQCLAGVVIIPTIFIPLIYNVSRKGLLNTKITLFQKITLMNIYDDWVTKIIEEFGCIKGFVTILTEILVENIPFHGSVVTYIVYRVENKIGKQIIQI